MNCRDSIQPLWISHCVQFHHRALNLSAHIYRPSLWHVSDRRTSIWCEMGLGTVVNFRHCPSNWNAELLMASLNLIRFYCLPNEISTALYSFYWVSSFCSPLSSSYILLSYKKLSLFVSTLQKVYFAEFHVVIKK